MTADADTSNSKIGKKSTGKRKFHKKSRNGCATCKRRRVKCDEGRPICGNCERMNIECVYVKAEDVVLPSKQNVEKSIHKQVIMGQTVKTEHTTQHETAVPKQGASSIMDNHTLNYVSDAINAATSVPLQPSESLQSSAIPDLGIPSTPIIPNSTSLPLSPISQLIQQNLPQSPAAMQLLNSFPPDMQIKLVQQFQQLPVDKQQQLYQSLPMSIKPSSNMSELPPAHIPDDVGSLLSNLKPSADSISEFLGDLIPDRNLIKPSNMNMDVTPTPQELAAHIQQRKQNSKDIPNDRHHGVSANMNSNSTTSNSSNNSSKSNQAAGPSLSPDSIRSSIHPLSNSQSNKNGTDLNMLDLRLMYHYTTKVWPTITAAGISDSKIWSDDIPMLAFQYPFLMHSVLAFSATHLSRNEKGLDQCVTCHRAEALRLLGDAVLEMSPENTDALVASALILIMDSLANASLPTSSSIKSLPPSAWIFHVKGAATILTAVWPLSETSRFYKFISVDLGDLADIGYDLISGELANTSDGNENARPDGRSRERGSSSSPLGNSRDSTTSPANEKYSKTSPNPNISARTDFASTSSQFKKQRYSRIECFDEDISDMFPIPLTSPYFPTLAYMARLHKERYKSDFILRIFAFPALLDKRFLGLLINCDLSAMRIMRCYYKLLRNFTEEMKEKVWFLEGVSSVLPVDVEQYAGGGGMHMMLDFLGGPSTIDDDGNGENYVAKSAVQSGLLDTNNLPSASMAGDLGLDETGLNNDADIDD